jgi:hypothetical protein
VELCGYCGDPWGWGWRKKSPRGDGDGGRNVPETGMGQGVEKYPPVNPHPVDIHQFLYDSFLFFYQNINKSRYKCQYAFI